MGVRRRLRLDLVENGEVNAIGHLKSCSVLLGIKISCHMTQNSPMALLGQ